MIERINKYVPFDGFFINRSPCVGADQSSREGRFTVWGSSIDDDEGGRGAAC